MRRAIFLDRDGVINKRLVGDYVKSPEKFELLPGVKDALKRLKKMGYLLIVVSNQQGIGKGIMTDRDLERVNRYMLKLLPEIDDVFYCTELEENNPWCRKPRPGMLLEAIKKWDIDPFSSWIIGDSESDMIAGKAVGCRTILIGNKESKFSDAHTQNLMGAVYLIKAKGVDKIKFRTKIKLITYYHLKRIDDYLGTVYYYLWKKASQKNISKIISKASEVYFDRTDLIGDAIVSIPLFFALKRMGIKFKILTSKYNNWVLSPFFDTEIVTEYPETTKFGSAIWDSLAGVYFSIERKIKKRKRENKIFFALKQKTDKNVLDRFKNAYIVSCLGKFSDFLYSDYICNSKLFNENHQLVESYLTPWKELGIDKYIEECPKELDEFVERIASKKIKRLTKEMTSKGDFIILFVGNKEYRRLPPAFWAKLAMITKEKWNILIIDDSRKTNEILKQILPRSNKIRYIDSLRSLWDGMYIAKYAKWVIGVDGGGFNFLQVPTNAIEIILYVNPERWKPFSIGGYNLIKQSRKFIAIKTKTRTNKIKGVIYYKDPLRYVNEALCRLDPKVMMEFMRNDRTHELLHEELMEKDI